MRLRDILGLVIALILAVGVALIARVFLTKTEPTQPVAQQQPLSIAKVLVAGKNLMEGERVRRGDLSWQEWPKQYVQPVYITEGAIKLESLEGSIVRFHILRGEPVLLPNLVRSTEMGVLSAVLDPGKRAVSIDVTPATASSGLVVPGDIVDVILSATITGEGNVSRGKSETILSKVKVVAIDTDLSNLGDKTKTPPHVATLEVTPQQAELLLAASKDGTLSLSLHSFLKAPDVSKTAEVGASQKRKQEKILIMRGKERTTIEFQEKQ